MELVPDETRDILKKLYQFLVPKVIRHDLGEYYTPDWLAERCLDLVGYGPKVNGLLKKRILDPGCGSGTFVILSIKRAKEHAKLKNIDPSQTLSQITKNIMGFDLNPLAVISARTNYLLAVAELLPHRNGEITIPIYLCDSINPPSAVESPDLFGGSGGSFIIKTSVGVFTFPEILIKKEMIQKVTLMLEESVKKNLPKEKFIEKVIKEFNINDKKEIQSLTEILGETYLKLIELEQKGINGIWARIIKNAFAPLFVGRFDFIVGNPPWVNWSSLPKEYRKSILSIWSNYDLFEHKGLDARLGKSCDDISILMTYVSIDKYLSLEGKLSFIITQSVFKTVGGGEGFRRFRLGKKGTPFQILQVDDMVSLQPFEGATNRTAVFYCKKGVETKYPLPYTIWLKNKKTSISIDWSQDEVLSNCKVKYFKAFPLSDPQSSWITIKLKNKETLNKILGDSFYNARVGLHTLGANGVFWVKKNGEKNGFAFIQNFVENVKREVPLVTAEIETELIYSLVRGRDITKWGFSPSLNIVLPYTVETGYKPILPEILKKNYPRTYDYFKQFEEILLQRQSSTIKQLMADYAFYSIYAIGPYSFSSFKVVWKEITTSLDCCVVPYANRILLDHKLTYVPLENYSEANYLAATLNSSPSRFCAKAFIVSTQQSTHVLDNINVPQFNPSNKVHLDLAQLSILAHERTASGIQVNDLEEQIDELAAELWGLTKQELKDIKDSLEELN